MAGVDSHNKISIRIKLHHQPYSNPMCASLPFWYQDYDNNFSIIASRHPHPHYPNDSGHSGWLWTHPHYAAKVKTFVLVLLIWRQRWDDTDVDRSTIHQLLLWGLDPLCSWPRQASCWACPRSVLPLLQHENLEDRVRPEPLVGEGQCRWRRDRWMIRWMLD